QSIADAPVRQGATDRVRVGVPPEQDDVRLVGRLGEDLLQSLSSRQSALLPVGHNLCFVHGLRALQKSGPVTCSDGARALSGKTRFTTGASLGETAGTKRAPVCQIFLTPHLFRGTFRRVWATFCQR